MTLSFVVWEAYRHEALWESLLLLEENVPLKKVVDMLRKVCCCQLRPAPAREGEAQRDRQHLLVVVVSCLEQALMAKAAALPVLFQDWRDLGM